VVTAPLVAESSAIGALILGVTEAPERTTLELLGALADVAAAAIQRGQLYDEVTTQANRLDRVMESVNFGLLLLDPQRRVILANQLAQVRLSHLTDVVMGEELTALGGHRLERFLTPRANESHTQEITLDGSIYEITTVPVGATGAEGGWLMVLHDATQDRAMQQSIQQHQRLAAVGQLAAGIAHDFNNIVAVITLYVQMLQRNPALQQADHDRLSVIRQQAQNASKLIRQILDFSRQTLIELQPTDLKTLLEESVALWNRTLPESIVFRLEVELDGAALILGEASSLQQALTNLAVNARDAMPHGGELRLLLRSVVVGDDETPPVTGLKRGRWYEVYVIDNGMGISPEHLPHIFDPFFTTKEIGKGTGLGLAQVYGIVQQHGGLVTAQSELGKGTSICLFLPALTEKPQIAQEMEPLDVAAEGSETILLVEDNAPAREATKALLEMMGYRVFAAADGRAGLDLFHRYGDSIQLVLSDLVMPEMGGLELQRKIHSENPAICVLIMTGYPLEDERHLLAESSAVEWLQKPFTVKQLTVAVRSVLERSKQMGEEQEDTNVAKG
jgi:signal transduction histidine kinase/ActR/RegA family two-component response regulator